MAMRRKRGEKKPLAFYVIIALSVVLSIAFVIWLPIPEPYTTPAKILVAMLLIVVFAFLGIFIYARKLRK